MAKRILALFLSIVLVASLASCSDASKNSIGIKVGKKISEYVHYDPEDFYADTEKLMSLAESDDTKEMLELYDSLYSDTLYIIDLWWSCYIELSKDSDSEYYTEEMDYISDVQTMAKDSFCSAAHAISIGSNADVLREHIGNDEIFEDYVEYVPYSDDLLELFAEEKELVNDYLTLDKLTGDFYNESGDIYMKLVKVRNSIAEKMGYESYAEYMDITKYNRDYTADDLEKFYAAVKSVDLDRLNDQFYTLCECYPAYCVEEEQAAKDLKTVVSGVSDSVDEAMNFMLKNKLYSFPSSENALESGYMQQFRYNNTAYVYDKLDGYFDDIYYIVHELGHFSNAYFVPMSNPIFNEGNYDIFEVHSQGLEFLCSARCCELVETEDPALFCCDIIGNIQSGIISGCLYDEWQRGVYNNPDMTIEEIDQLFIELCREYHIETITCEADLPLQWRMVIHNFENPMYYISYATSCFAALQIWDMSNSDFDAAVETYEKVLFTDPYTTTFVEMLDDCGLVSFSNSEAVADIITGVMDYADEKIAER